jgi:hypothetical protein
MLSYALGLVFIVGIIRGWVQQRRRLGQAARPLTPEEMGLLNVIRLSSNRLWEIRKRGTKTVTLEEWR